MDELLPIGEFSARCGLSPKMLRTYASAGVLTPAAVDRTSGYRWYASGQLHEAKGIALLRRAGVPLRDIAGFLTDPAPVAFDRWEHQLESEVTARRLAFADARRHFGICDRAPIGGGEVTMFRAGSATHTGHVRPSNQDAVLVDHLLFAVADGCGDVGDVASRLALETLRAAFAADRTVDGLLDAFQAANQAVWSHARQHAKRTAIGTTLTAVGDVGDGLAVVNVGDSRAYVYDRTGLRRVTDDHTVVNDLVRAGELTEQEARRHPQRSILTRVVGMGPHVEPDVVAFDTRPGDRLLLCTDGLYNDVAEDDITSVLGAAADPEDAARELVARSNGNGGNDNVSVVVVDVG